MILSQNVLQKRRDSRRRGLTLVELIIVMMILVALAGVLIPLLPSMLTRAHVSAHTTNVTELDKAIVTYQNLNNGYPDQWDSLTDGTALITYLPGGVLDPQTPPANGQAGGELQAALPTDAEVTALQSAGISKVHLMVGTPQGTPGDGGVFDPTFDYYASPAITTGGASTATPIDSTTTQLAFLDPANNPQALARLQTDYPSFSTTARYVVFGIGPRCSLIGRGAVTSPVHFGDTPSVTPEFGYNRFAAIFKVSDTTVPINSAVLVGVAAIHDIGLTGLDSEFQNWYQINKGGS